MTLEARAARAVRSIQQSVSTATPVPVGLVVRRQRTSVVGVLAGAAAVAALTFAIAVAMPASVDQVTDEVANEKPITPSEPSPSKDPAAPVVVPVDKTYPPVAYGVYQHNPTSSDPSAFAKFYGIAIPGTTVTATSEYGSASTVVGPTGEFVIKVSFTDPPYNVAFPVTVTRDGESHAFTFTSLWDPNSIAVTASRTYLPGSLRRPMRPSTSPSLWEASCKCTRSPTSSPEPSLFR